MHRLMGIPPILKANNIILRKQPKNNTQSLINRSKFYIIQPIIFWQSSPKSYSFTYAGAVYKYGHDFPLNFRHTT